MIGTETAGDVFTVHGEGILARHAWVSISEAGLQVEDLGGGTLVNGYPISERVQVEYPVSVQTRMTQVPAELNLRLARLDLLRLFSNPPEWINTRAMYPEN